MKVDLERSGSYTRRLDRALRQGNLARAAALNRARRRVDDRFDPAKALAGTARYLKLAKERFGREDLAFVSYHMGMGNLESVIARFGGGPRSYAELYFDSTPLRHAAAYRRLASFGDDSSNYYWKLGAAIEIMRLARTRPRRAWSRPRRCRRPTTPPARCCSTARRRAICATLPDNPADTSLEAAPGVQLRPEALAIALYMAAEVRAISDAPALRVTRRRRRRLDVPRLPRATPPSEQALAFQYVLDRLQVLNVIAWSRTERTIRVTASRDAEVLEPLLDRLGGKRSDRRHPDARRAARRPPGLRLGTELPALGRAAARARRRRRRGARC